MSPELDLPDEGDSVMVSRRGATKRLTAAAILAGILIVVVAVGLLIRESKKHPSLPPGGVLAANQPKEPEPAKPKDAEPTKEPEKTTEPEKSKEPGKEPEMGKDVPKPKDSDKPKEPAKEPEKPKEPEKSAPPPPDLSAERRTSEERREVGRAVANATLLTSGNPGAPWQRVGANVPIMGVSRLMSLPATQSEVRLNDAIRLDLWVRPSKPMCRIPRSWRSSPSWTCSCRRRALTPIFASAVGGYICRPRNLMLAHECD